MAFFPLIYVLLYVIVSLGKHVPCSLRKKQHVCVRYYSPYKQSHLTIRLGQRKVWSAFTLLSTHFQLFIVPQPLVRIEPLLLGFCLGPGAYLLQNGHTIPGLHSVPQLESAMGILGSHLCSAEGP